jgi:hypothetical protein
MAAIYKCFKDQNLITEEIQNEINDKIIKMELQNHILFGYTSIVMNFPKLGFFKPRNNRIYKSHE